MTIRRSIFWAHLVLGLAAGLVIAITAFTGVTMAFEKQILAFAERDVRRVTPPTNEMWSLPELMENLRAAYPDARPQSIVISRDPAAAIAVTLNRTNTVYLNPYTGEIKPQSANKARAFFQLMERVHRWLGVAPQQQVPGGEAPPPSTLRTLTSTVIGVSVCIFLALCLSGFIIWFPRNWQALKSVIWFKRGLNRKARDWNWHNVFGFWSLPVLVLITCTGIIMHFRAVGDWLYKRPEGDAANAGLKLSTPEPGTPPLGQDDLLAAAKTAIPDWDTITLRSGNRRGGGAPRPQNAGQRGEARSPQPITISVMQSGWSPVPVQLTLDPFTGEVLRKESLSDFGYPHALRTMAKSMHTGEWAGWFGQLLALLAAVGALVLVYTGFALSWRRFFGRKA